MKKPRKLSISIFIAYFLVNLFLLSTVTSVSTTRREPKWYYDNFDDEDRMNIRIAMDYAIPREEIINGILEGYSFPLATPIVRNSLGYDDTFQAREFSIEKALEYMERVFGYKYDPFSEIDEERETYFNMGLMAPTSREDRMQWAALTTQKFQKIGIDVTLEYCDWPTIMPCVFSPPEEDQGFDYEHGGYDGLFIGWGASPDSDVSHWFGKDKWPPYGTNIGYLNDPTADDIVDRSLHSLDITDRVKALKEFQAWFHTHVPYFIIAQLADIWALDPELEGVSFSFDYPNFGNWSHPTANVVTVHTPRDFQNLNPLMVSSNFDWLSGVRNGGFYGSLITRYPNDPMTWYGDLAESWTVSENGLEWVFNLHNGIKFSDGSPCTVDDVLFTYSKWTSPEVGAYDYTGAIKHLDVANIHKLNETAIRFRLNSFYAYTTNLFTQCILSKAEMENIPDDEWMSHATNTRYAPIGTGPYKMDKANSDVSQSQVRMILNPYYDNTIRDPNGQFNNFDRIPEINSKLLYTVDDAVTALQSGKVNIIDSHVGLRPYVYEIEAYNWGRLVIAPGWGHQGLYLNNLNPIWGMNPMDPTTMYPEDGTEPEVSASYEGPPPTIPSFSPGFDLFTAIALIITSSIYLHQRRCH